MAFEDASVTQELLSDKVYGLVRKAILDGTQAPGSRLVESEIARSLGVSQAPVRDAIKRLAHEGMVTSLPRRGSYVTELSPEEFTIGRELRAAVEKLGAETVARLSGVDSSGLRAIAERMVDAATADDRAELRLLDMEFHRTAVELAGSPLLIRVWSIMEPTLISQHVIGDPAFTGDWDAVAQDHVRLVALLDAGNAAVAGQAFFVHAVGQGEFPSKP
ncbi:GntR family transcriptional regulator [Kribbella sp. NPDC058245]|uniref:GntR family transcriptional regulator n=1 Tax=Kribbella sp. NPDC058245 TaxID=3346399 RepID=UPI0036EB4FD9